MTKPKFTIFLRSFGGVGNIISHILYIANILSTVFDLHFIVATKKGDAVVDDIAKLKKLGLHSIELKECDNMGDFKEIFEYFFKVAKELRNPGLSISQGVFFTLDDVVNALSEMEKHKCITYTIAIAGQHNNQAFPGLAGYHAFKVFHPQYFERFVRMSRYANSGTLPSLPLRLGEKIESVKLGGVEEVIADVLILLDELKTLNLAWGQPLPNALFLHRVSNPLRMDIKTSSDVDFFQKMARKVLSALKQISAEFGDENLINVILTYQHGMKLV